MFAVGMYLTVAFRKQLRLDEPCQFNHRKQRPRFTYFPPSGFAMVDATPGGRHVCLLMPALPFLFGTLDDMYGHYRRYTKRTMNALFDGLPGRVEKLRYFNLIGVPGWFVKGRVLKQRRHTNDNYAIINAPLHVVRPLEKLISPPLGMSFIGSFRKD